MSGVYAKWRVRFHCLRRRLEGESCIRGMITLRGEAVTVADLGEVLGVSGTPSESRSRLIAVRFNSSTVCFLAGRILGLLEVDEAKLDVPPPFIAGIRILN